MVMARHGLFPKRILRRYRFFICAAIFILIIQLVIGYQFYIYHADESEYAINSDYLLPRDSHFTNIINKKREYIFPVSSQINAQGKDIQVLNRDIGDVSPKHLSVPKCHITEEESLSAISRAKTKTCKTEIADTACLSQTGKLYTTALPRSCPLKNTGDAGVYRGCYRDERYTRDLTGSQMIFPDNSPKRCIDYCFQIGARYAGVQYTNECWCGATYGRYGALTESWCAVSSCPGNSTQTCGGYLTNRIFSTGIESRVLRVVPMTNTTYIPIENPIRILYLLTLNGRALRQIYRLFRAIYHRDHYFFIHIDVRQDYLFRELSKLTTNYSNIRMATTRFASIWGGASLLTVHLTCLKAVLEMSDWSWDYVLNLSESDFAVKSNEQLVTFLTANRGSNFLKSHTSDTARFIKKQGLDKTFLECENRMWRLGKRDLPTGILYDGGSDWVCLYRDFVSYVVQSTDPLITGLKNVFRYALLPVESFFHTVIQNGVFCHTVVNNNLHLTNWRRKQGCKCQYKHIVDWCGCSPNDFKPDDLPKLMLDNADSWNNQRYSLMLILRGYVLQRTTPEPIFFARKFEAIVNQEIINTFESIVYKTSLKDVVGTSSYWQNEYHYLDRVHGVNDTFLSLYESIMRLGTKWLSQSRCIVNPRSLREVTLFNIHDTFHGLLVKFVTDVNQEIEVHARPLYKFTNLNSGLSDRLISLQVGTDFDPKELILRNYAGIVGPHSSLTLLHSWGSGHEFTFTAVWIDPTDLIAASYDIEVPLGAYIGSHKPSLRLPLRPGVWKVKVLVTWHVAAEVSFVVVPYTVLNGRKISENEARSNHNGPSGLYGHRNFSDFMSVMSLYDNRDTLVRQAAVDGRKVGDTLEAWCDELVAQFWVVEAVCASSGPASRCENLAICEETTWSTATPDPKSQLKPVDPVTGLIR